MKKYQIIEIEWVDSLHISGWQTEENVGITPLKDMTNKTIGYFLEEDEKSIMVVQSYRRGAEVDSIMEIPKRSILKKRLLK